MIEKIGKKYFLLIVTFLCVVSLGITFKVLEKRITENVIKELKRDYVPGPFSPGIDPENLDKADEQIEQSSSFNQKFYDEIFN